MKKKSVFCEVKTKLLNISFHALRTGAQINNVSQHDHIPGMLRDSSFRCRVQYGSGALSLM